MRVVARQGQISGAQLRQSSRTRNNAEVCALDHAIGTKERKDRAVSDRDNSAAVEASGSAAISQSQVAALPEWWFAQCSCLRLEERR